jgi:uncharacterized NAD-dependent epimerase/dehydratase family protein
VPPLRGGMEKIMSKKLTKVQQEQMVVEIACNMETMSEEEFDYLYNQLDVDYQMQVDDDVREFADNAVGDEHWDSDE